MQLSVVIPTLDEASNLLATLSSLPQDAQVVVSDGGSTDETVAIATRFGARLIRGVRGRAGQLNRGAAVCEGDTLLFLHADCRLGGGAREAIERALDDPNVVGGSFQLRIRGDAGDKTSRLGLVARASNARARYLGVPYGDQGLFVRTSVFNEAGGYPELPIMEDIALVRELKRIGKLVRVDTVVSTGPRHWQHLGVVRTTLLNWAVASLFVAGMPAKRLAPIYTRLRGKKRPDRTASTAYV